MKRLSMFVMLCVASVLGMCAQFVFTAEGIKPYVVDGMSITDLPNNVPGLYDHYTLEAGSGPEGVEISLNFYTAPGDDYENVCISASFAGIYDHEEALENLEGASQQTIIKRLQRLGCDKISDIVVFSRANVTVNINGKEYPVNTPLAKLLPLSGAKNMVTIEEGLNVCVWFGKLNFRADGYTVLKKASADYLNNLLFKNMNRGIYKPATVKLTQLKATAPADVIFFSKE